MRARGLTLRRGGVAVVDRIDLDLGLRGCTAILGPNGAGKSLLLRLLHGLEPPEAGAVTWNGAPASREVTARQALVFQTPVLLRRSVGANLDFVLRARRRDRGLRAALLDRVGLGDKADRPARLLSGGEKQRLALARALATGPDVLFLDEPTASLDPGSVLMIERIVREEAERGTRLVIVTHDVAQARRLADDVVFLHRGRVIEHAPTDTFFAAPAAEAARDFLAGRIVL
ncbi:ATP-binding cassette domain-containing protein [Roseivivax jejudonensis]|nr:ATP-binding cassette domain-containing protein [Roseivivax jejudonensis]